MLPLPVKIAYFLIFLAASTDAQTVQGREWMVAVVRAKAIIGNNGCTAYNPEHFQYIDQIFYLSVPLSFLSLICGHRPFAGHYALYQWFARF